VGRRDYRHREPKKTKKGTRKPESISILPASTIVEVVKKGKREKAEEIEDKGDGEISGAV
jgi:hypothetical protein